MMKKILCAIVLMAAAGSLQAQDKIVRKARLQIDEIQNLMANKERKPKETERMNQLMAETKTLLAPALTSPETKKELANAWDIEAKLHAFTFAPLLDNVIAKQPTDTTKLAEEIYAALDAKEQVYLAEKGAKEPKYTILNRVDVQKFRPYIAYCGQMFYQNKQYAKAEDAFKRWLNYTKTYTILEGEESEAEKEQTPQIAYFCCLSAYFAKDYKTLMEYIPLARQFTQDREQVNQLYITALIEQGDTASWLKACRDIVLEDPTGNEGIAQNVLSYFISHSKTKEAVAFADELLAQDPGSKLANYVRGFVLMNDRKYAEAIPFFVKASETDPTYSDAFFNAGVCYSNIGYDMNDKLTGKKMTPAQQKAEIDKVKAEYAKAEPFFLKVKELEPNDPLKWAGRLATIYYILGDKAKQAEYEKLLQE